MKLSKKLIITGIAIFALIGFVGFASAHDEYGNRGWYGGHMMGYGPHMGYGYGPHMGYYDTNRYSGLSDNEIEKIDKARDDFYKSTEKTREAIYQKRTELSTELAKANPDTKKLKTIQRELSKLEANLDQETLDYEVKINKIAPNAQGGFAGRDSRYDNRGGYCW